VVDHVNSYDELVSRLVVAPSFPKKTKHSLHVCPGSPHIQQQNRNIKTMFIYNGIHIVLILTTIRVSQSGC
jgi:hypothetical protein